MAAAPYVSMSGADLTARMLQAIGVVGIGSTPNGTQTQLAYEQANLCIDGWGADRNMIFRVAVTDFPLVADLQVYTVGPGGDFDIPRPVKIQDAGMVFNKDTSNEWEQQIAVLDDDQWASTPLKRMTGIAWPQAVWPEMTFPLINLYVVPIPQGITAWLRIYCATVLDLLDVADPNAMYAFPPAYLEFLILDAAKALLIYYPRQMGREFYDRHAQAETRIKSTNVYVPVCSIPLQIPRGRRLITSSQFFANPYEQ